ncbi:Rhodanese-like domain-containing protein [Xylaria palmicola]|nr:Rhodanese-like domain-containing protein [Xylaria palmicola]
MLTIPTRRLLATSGTPLLRASFCSEGRAAAAAATFRAPALALCMRLHHQRRHANPRRGTQAALPSRSVGARWLTTSATGSKIWTFDEIRSLATSSGSKGPTLVDVREPAELASTGRIPGAVNIPITTSPDSFHISGPEFEERFGFARPDKADGVVFYCKAGVRSRAAAGFAREAGWTDVGEYPGSWLEWSGRGGEVER